MIEEITMYRTRGQLFSSEEKALQYRQDLIGEFMDKAPVLLSPRDRIKLVDFITEHRAQLLNLLAY